MDQLAAGDRWLGIIDMLKKIFLTHLLYIIKVWFINDSKYYFQFVQPRVRIELYSAMKFLREMLKSVTWNEPKRNESWSIIDQENFQYLGQVKWKVSNPLKYLQIRVQTDRLTLSGASLSLIGRWIFRARSARSVRFRHEKQLRGRAVQRENFPCSSLYFCEKRYQEQE